MYILSNRHTYHHQMSSLFKWVPNYPCTLLNCLQNFTFIILKTHFIKYFLLEFNEEFLHYFLVLSSRNHHFSSNLISFVFIKKSPSITESNWGLILDVTVILPLCILNDHFNIEVEVGLEDDMYPVNLSALVKIFGPISQLIRGICRPLRNYMFLYFLRLIIYY